MILFVFAAIGLVELGDVQGLVDRLKEQLGNPIWIRSYLGNRLDIGGELLFDALEVVAIVVSNEVDRQTKVPVTS